MDIWMILEGEKTLRWRLDSEEPEGEFLVAYDCGEGWEEEELIHLFDNLGLGGHLALSHEEGQRILARLIAMARLTNTTDRLVVAEEEEEFRGPFTFGTVGLAPGDEIAYVLAPEIRATVAGDREVIFEGEAMDLEELDRRLRHGAPTRDVAEDFMVKGELLVDRRRRFEAGDRTEPEDIPLPGMNFFELQIPEGSLLETGEEEENATVLGRNLVEVQGSAMDFSAYVRRLYRQGIAIGDVTFEGERLKDRKDRLIAERREERQQSNRPETKRPLTFDAFNIPEGANLTFKRDRSIVAKVLGGDRVLYDGRIWRLTELANALIDDDKHHDGLANFFYHGVLLADIVTHVEAGGAAMPTRDDASMERTYERPDAPLLDEDNPQGEARVVKPRFTFEDYHIPVGAKLVFLQDESVEVEVVDGRRIAYDGVITTMSALAQRLLGTNYPVQGPAFFTYHGEKLTDYRDRLDEEA